MTVNRRDFVASVGWSFVASTAARAAESKPATPTIARDYSDWSAVRAEFDLSPEWLHFSQFYIVSHPRPVRAAIERFRRMLDANPFTTVEQGMGFEAFLGGGQAETRPERVQRAAADYIGGRPEEVALTDSTTQGLALIYNGLTLNRDEEILTTTHDHYVHHEAMRLAAERSGASIRRIALYDAPATASAEEMSERLKRAIRPRTRIIGLTWVHSCTGVRLPLRSLTQVVADANRSRGEHEQMLVVLDAVHGFGNQEEALAELGCDFAAAGTHKWIFAPRGTGIIWAPAKNWGLLRPTIPTFYNATPFTAWEEQQPPKPPTQAAWVSPGGFKAYEHQWAMAEAFEFHRAIGRKRIAERIVALNSQCKEGLAGIPKVKVLTPRDPKLSAGIICFQIEGQTTDETVHRLLGHKVIGSSSPYKVSYPRLAPSLVNDETQVEAALRAVRAIA
ncbi:MAG TPA: aminotransferase class V-fold PLP-dependent enzyme [Steroidobacteraceae bacterium]|jgi:selenocysteine lyase/cysteine desulfurase|nr:aminotransferase class V-fold PLP-dependent enzyme [Steroidobacteraceae bacterium]